MTIKYCCGLVFDRGRNNVLLVRKARPQWQAGRLNGVGGKVEADENSMQAMLREWSEEVTDKWRPVWRIAVALSGLAAGETEARYSVDFFVGFTDLANLFTVAGKEVDGEVLGVYQVKSLYFPPMEHTRVAQGACIPNLAYIIPMMVDPTFETGIIIERPYAGT